MQARQSFLVPNRHDATVEQVVWIACQEWRALMVQEMQIYFAATTFLCFLGSNSLSCTRLSVQILVT